MWSEVLTWLITNHLGKLTGSLAGLLFGILVVTLGIVKAIFVIICLVAGYIIGKRADDAGSWRELLSRLWSKDS